MQITIKSGMKDVVVDSSEEQFDVIVGTSDATANIMFDGGSTLSIIESESYPIKLCSAVPQFESGKQYLLHLENGKVFFASKELVPHRPTEFTVVNAAEGITQQSYKGGILLTPPHNGLRDITYIGGAFFDGAELTFDYPSEFVHRRWLKEPSQSGGVEPEYVDLGLSVLWATTNVGAEAAEDYGWYMRLGDTEEPQGLTAANDNDPILPLATSRWQEIMTGMQNGTTPPPSTEEEIAAIYSDLVGTYAQDIDASFENGVWKGTAMLSDDLDPVVQAFGHGWRMPTAEEYTELIENTNVEQETINGIDGVRLTSTVEGYEENSIFMPMAGVRGFDGSLVTTGVGQPLMMFTKTLSLKDNQSFISLFRDGRVISSQSSEMVCVDAQSMNTGSLDAGAYRFYQLPIRGVKPKE